MLSSSPAPARGATLVELLVTVVILGAGVAALVGGIGSSVLMSGVHRSQATAGTVVREYAEAIGSGVSSETSPYVPCADASAYSAPPGFAPPPGFSASVVSVGYWDGSTFSSACSSDTGAQRLALEVSDGSGRVTAHLDLVLRLPCPPVPAEDDPEVVVPSC